MTDGRIARLAWIIVAAGAVLRAALLLTAAEPPAEWRGDAVVYREILEGLARGGFDPRAWVWPPGYPLLALPLSFVAGSSSALLAISWLAGAAIPLLVFRIARSLGEPLVGVLAAAFFAFSPEAALASIVPLSDAPGLAMLLLAAALAIGARAGDSRRAAFAGAAAGLSVLIRPEAFLGAAFLPLATPASRTRRAFLAYTGAAAAVIAPYVIGLHAASGVWGLSLKPAMNITKQEIYTASPDYASSRRNWEEQMRTFQGSDGTLDPRRLAASASPRDYFASSAAWIAWIDHAATGIRSLDGFGRGIAGLSLLGLFLPGPGRTRALFLALSAPFLAVSFFVVPLGRFLLPAFPAIAAGLARLVLFIGSRFGVRRAPRIAQLAVLACVGAAIFGAIESFREARQSRWAHRVHEIESELGLGNVDRARALLATARPVSGSEEDLVVLRGRIEEVAGIVAFREGRLDEARDSLLEAERITGPSPRIDFNLGVILVGLGAVEEGRARIERAAASDDPRASTPARAFLRDAERTP